MEISVYHFTIFAFLLAVFTAAVYFSFKGYKLAKYFLWSWALLLAMAAPFISSVPSTSTSDIIAGIALVFFVYASLFIFSKRNERKLEIAHEEIRRVLAESNTRMDEERRSIARVLHDEVNGKLISSKLELQKLLPIIKDTIHNSEKADKAREIVEKTLGLLSSAYEDSRGIIRNTRIEVIDSIGLTAALESLVGHYKGIVEKPNIALEHNLPKRPNLSPSAAVNAYRIIQEALLNVIKHAEAANVRISVQYNKVIKRFDIVIADDGIGIKTKNEQGIGLIDMRERARMLGGELRVESGNSSGTVISFSFSGRES